VEKAETTTATELATLPGLESVPAGTVSEPRPEHWLERGPSKRLMLFSGRSHPVLAQKIAERLGVELGAVDLGSFANGETYCRFEESIRGADVFLVCPPGLEGAPP
jgi:ribose-phosphate pyrophosphokinase